MRDIEVVVPFTLSGPAQRTLVRIFRNQDDQEEVSVKIGDELIDRGLTDDEIVPTRLGRVVALHLIKEGL